MTGHQAMPARFFGLILIGLLLARPAAAWISGAGQGDGSGRGGPGIATVHAPLVRFEVDPLGVVVGVPLAVNGDSLSIVRLLGTGRGARLDTLRVPLEAVRRVVIPRSARRSIITPVGLTLTWGIVVPLWSRAEKPSGPFASLAYALNTLSLMLVIPALSVATGEVMASDVEPPWSCRTVDARADLMQRIIDGTYPRPFYPTVHLWGWSQLRGGGSSHLGASLRAYRSHAAALLVSLEYARFPWEQTWKDSFEKRSYEVALMGCERLFGLPCGRGHVGLAGLAGVLRERERVRFYGFSRRWEGESSDTLLATGIEASVRITAVRWMSVRVAWRGLLTWGDPKPAMLTVGLEFGSFP